MANHKKQTQSFAIGVTSRGKLGNGNEKLKDMAAMQNFNLQYIPREQFVVNEKNKEYSQDGIESLKSSIIVNGLRHNLAAIYDSDKNNYRIVSGERRYRAICSMSEEEYLKIFPTGVPCKIEKPNLDEIEEEILLISANADARELDIKTKRWQINRLKELYRSKQKKGEADNIAKEIAQLLEMSERQVLRYMNTDRLIPELAEILDQKKITLTDASKFSSLPEDDQRKLLSLYKENGKIDNEEYTAIKKTAEQAMEETKKYKQELERKEEELERSNNKVDALENKLKEISTAYISNSKENQDAQDVLDNVAEIRMAEKAKKKAEEERDALRNELEALKKNAKSPIAKEDYENLLSENRVLQAIANIESNVKIIIQNIKDVKNEEIIAQIEILKVKIEETL